MIRLTREAARRLRLRAQGLASPVADDVAAVVAAAAGLQAQEHRSAALSVRSRSEGHTAADVDRALFDERTVVRTWCMRGTLHLVATADLPVVHSVFGPAFATRGPEPKRLAAFGLDEAAVEACVDRIWDLLAEEGPLTRDAIAARLVESGVGIDPSGQAPAFLVRRAALRGVLCQVAPVDETIAYDRVESWVGMSLDDSPAREEALATLARRYLDAYGPASLADLAAWSGLPMADVRAGWASLDGDDVVAVEIDGEAALVPEATLAGTGPAPAGDPPVRLLPGYDTYLLGYARDHRPVPPGYEPRVWPGGGVIRPTLVVDGRVAGTWRLDRSRATPAVVVDAFGSLADAVAAGVEREAADVGRFLGEPVDCRMSTP